ncbi:hypothetical protein ACFVWP_20680 [Streptomyces sp. NPDC058175]|uniref:hypothetical protein n=1 Tax=Streptomyces sp. NPDC058175 TaxID=3346367 RepID=UPI0036E1D44D
MILETVTKAQAVQLPMFARRAKHELGKLYFWAEFSDDDHTFFVRPAAENELGCLADVFGIRDGIVQYVAREMFIREGERLRLLEEA